MLGSDLLVCSAFPISVAFIFSIAIAAPQACTCVYVCFSHARGCEASPTHELLGRGLLKAGQASKVAAVFRVVELSGPCTVSWSATAQVSEQERTPTGADIVEKCGGACPVEFGSSQEGTPEQRGGHGLLCAQDVQ